ncbi:MAG: hypothetical protein MZV64_68435 [Ignavibacteriales bacterium]|nr:hypothetical protein [Ignavibacteriales bacterium]
MQFIVLLFLKQDIKKADKLIEELRQHVGHEVGPIAKPEHIEIVDSLTQNTKRKNYEESFESTSTWN